MNIAATDPAAQPATVALPTLHLCLVPMRGAGRYGAAPTFADAPVVARTLTTVTVDLTDTALAESGETDKHGRRLAVFRIRDGAASGQTPKHMHLTWQNADGEAGHATMAFFDRLAKAEKHARGLLGGAR